MTSTAVAAVATSVAHPSVKLRAQLDQNAGEFKNALPAHMPVQKFIRDIMTACSMNGDLFTVDRASLLRACIRAAHDGLVPDGRDGVILPYRDNNQKSPTHGQMLAQWQPMIGGMLKRFRNSGQFLWVTAKCVRESDPFQYWIDENGEHLRHTPSDVGPYVKAYAMAKTKDGGTMIAVMSRADIDRRRAVSKAKDGTMWRDWWDEAAMKTVLRNLCKRLPMSSDLDEMVRRNTEGEEDAFDARPATPGASSAAANTDAEPHQVEITGIVTELERVAADDPDVCTPPADSPDSVGEETQLPDPDVERAFAAGAEACRGGIARRAVPGPYREPDVSHLTRSWLAGWDSAKASLNQRS